VTRLDLLVDRLKTLGGVKRAYKVGEVPELPKAPYCVLSLDTGVPSTYTNDGSSDTLRGLSVQIFAEDDDGVQDMAARADNAFRGVCLTELDHEPMSIRDLATNVTRDPDGEGLLYVLHHYQFQED